MEVQIAVKKTKHSYARMRDGVLYITLASHLSEQAKKRITEKFTANVLHRKYAPEHSLLQHVYDTGKLTLFTGQEKFVHLLPSGRGYSVMLQDTPMSDISLWQSLPRPKKKQYLFRALEDACYDDIVAEIRAWVRMTGVPSPKAISLSDTISRWGSCTSSKHIRISYRTLLLPYDLCTYVCLHEVIHLEHMHHRSKFWNALALLMPDFKKRVERIRHFH